MEQISNRERVRALIDNRDMVMQELNRFHFKDVYFKPHIEIDSSIDGENSLAVYDRFSCTIYISDNPDIYETPECFLECLAHEGLHFRNDFDCIDDVDFKKPEPVHELIDESSIYQYHNCNFAKSAAECGLFDRDYLLSWYMWLFSELKATWSEKYQGEYSPAITRQFKKLYGYSACIAPNTEGILESMRQQGIL